ncbi:MAG: hypothetical protein AW07_04787 [Candidatus Accumulibacter sp. SK-11]|nr:MAG: hypothetical protein AW07_04787 [Candidatus Accumulibacter sp. SK-11]
MRGEYRHDRRLVEEAAQACRVDSGHRGALQRMRQTALVRRRSGDQMGARAADVMLVLGDVRQVREIAERANDRLRLLARQAVEDCRQVLAGASVIVAMEADGADTDPLDQLEDRLALLRAQGVAEDTAEQPDVVAQRQVLVVDGVLRHLFLQ